MREEQDNAEEQEEQLINEEYKVWKKNTPYLYDTVITHALDWPSLTVDWLPETILNPATDYALHQAVIGTNTSGNEQNHLIVVNIKLPLEDSSLCPTAPQDKEGLLCRTDYKIEPLVHINHEGEINIARVMPHKGNIIATKSANKKVYIFDYTKHPNNSDRGPQLTLLGHNSEGYGLSWNHIHEGTLASGSDDHLICVWDLNGGSETNSELNPMRTLGYHHSVVNDVSWNPFEGEILASVGDDKKVIISDLRQEQPGIVVDAHTQEINGVDFNRIDVNLLATASSDKTVCVWDLRNMQQPLCRLLFHKDAVYGVRWAPFSQTMLATSGYDRRVLLWDLGRLADESPQDPSEGPAELLFIHGGHTSRVADLSWNLNDQFVVASVAEDNIIQVWQMTYALIAHPDFSVSLVDKPED